MLHPDRLDLHNSWPGGRGWSGAILLFSFSGDPYAFISHTFSYPRSRRSLRFWYRTRSFTLIVAAPSCTRMYTLYHSKARVDVDVGIKIICKIICKTKFDERFRTQFPVVLHTQVVSHTLARYHALASSHCREIFSSVGHRRLRTGSMGFMTAFSMNASFPPNSRLHPSTPTQRSAWRKCGSMSIMPNWSSTRFRRAVELLCRCSSSLHSSTTQKWLHPA